MEQKGRWRTYALKAIEVNYRLQAEFLEMSHYGSGVLQNEFHIMEQVSAEVAKLRSTDFREIWEWAPGFCFAAWVISDYWTEASPGDLVRIAEPFWRNSRSAVLGINLGENGYGP